MITFFTSLSIYLFTNNSSSYILFSIINLFVFLFLIYSFFKCSNEKSHNIQLQRIYEKDLELFNKKLEEHNDELKKYWTTRENLTIKINVSKKKFNEEIMSALEKDTNYVDFLKTIKTIEIFTPPHQKYYQKLEKLKLIKDNNNLKYRLLIRLDLCLDYNKYLNELSKVKVFFNENDFELDIKYDKKIENLKLKTIDETFYNKFYHLKIKNKSFEEEDLKIENNLFKIFAKNNFEENSIYKAELKTYLFLKEFKYYSLIRLIKELRVKIDSNYYDNWIGIEELLQSSTTKEIDVLNKMLNNKETKNSVELINQIKM